MKKHYFISLLLLVSVLLISCNTTNTSQSTPQSIQSNQPKRITLTTSNISSYLGIDVSDDSEIYIANYKQDDFENMRGSGWLAGNFEVRTFPKKVGYFENVKIEIEYTAETWDFLTFSKPENRFTFTIPIDGNFTKKIDVYDMVMGKNLFKSNPIPPINVKIISISGTFIEQ